jgi:flagellar protein FlaI
MLADINTFDMTYEDKKKFLEDTIEHIISDNNIYFDENSKDPIFYHIFRDFLGYGKIDILMHDDGIEDISCDGPETPIFIHHRKYEAIESNIYFDSESELNSFLVRLCQISGKQISIFAPIVDGKLPDGSRLQATLARTVTKGSTFTIRKFKEIPLTPLDLIEYNSMSTEMAAYFWMAIEDGASILFCGGTASGKTTALNALMLFIPSSHKIISIEDTREVNIPHKNWIAGTTRKGFATADENKTGKDIDMFDLIRAALRQRPRVIIVGEVRGKEAYSLFQAMATGHTAYATVHASTIHTLIQRLENPPIELPRALLTSLDVIVFQNAVDIGGKMVRRVTSITEIIKLDTDTNQLIFMAPYIWISKTDDRFNYAGSSKIFTRIKQQNEWTDEQLQQELNNRILVLEWMRKKKIKSYKTFGSIIAEYKKFPERILELAKRETLETENKEIFELAKRETEK